MVNSSVSSTLRVGASNVPDKPDQPYFDPSEPAENEFGSPPRPEQIWPPLEGEADDVDLEGLTEDDVVLNDIPLIEDTSVASAASAEDAEYEQWARKARQIDETIGSLDQIDAPAEIGEPLDERGMSPFAPRVTDTAEVPSESAAYAAAAGAATTEATDYERAEKAAQKRKGAPSQYRILEQSEGELSQLWSNVFFSTEHPAPKTIVVTTARRGDGATQIATALAMIGAEVNHEHRILLIDADLRNPGVAEVLGVRETPGVTDILYGRSTIEQCMQTVRLHNGNTLNVLVAGAPSDQPLAMVKSRQMRWLISQLQQSYDHIVIDATSSGSHPDAQMLGSMADGVLLVVAAGQTPRETAAEVKKRLDMAKVPCLGLVLNRREDPIPGMLYRVT